jgi:hypothetical protein
MYVSLVEVEEADEVYGCSTSWTKAVLGISTKSPFKIPTPPVSLFASSLDDISVFFPVFFFDHSNTIILLCPRQLSIARKKRESESKVLIRKRTAYIYQHARTGMNLTAKLIMISVILLLPAKTYALTK